MSQRPQFDRRAAGILLHLTSLTGPHGSGDLGPAAHDFVRFLSAAGRRWWQMLPVVPPGPAPSFSPYSAQSAFAGSPWLISLLQLQHDGLLPGSGKDRSANKPTIDIPRSIALRASMLRQAYDKFKGIARLKSPFHDFCELEKSWLDDWALFAALKHAHLGKQWLDWERGIRLRKPDAVRSATNELADEIDFHRFVQYLFDRQWRSLKKLAREQGVGLLGDLPIFVAADSADVWAHRELFTLHPDGRPSSISGCPPDIFSAKGQLWRHPQYRWANHAQDNFAWWVARFARELDRFDGVRVDHFLGFHRTWSIPGDAKDARKGKWLISPGRELFAAVKKRVGHAPIIAEDLGLLTREAEHLRDELGFPGMRVLQFGFGDNSDYLPHNYTPGCVAYTGTHDNDTARGWFTTASSSERKKALAYLDANPQNISRKMIRALMQSVAETVIIPMQDVLNLSSQARMNLPGTEGKNWRWRLTPTQLTAKLARELRADTTLDDRARSV